MAAIESLFADARSGPAPWTASTYAPAPSPVMLMQPAVDAATTSTREGDEAHGSASSRAPTPPAPSLTTMSADLGPPPPTSPIIEPSNAASTGSFSSLAELKQWVILLHADVTALASRVSNLEAQMKAKADREELLRVWHDGGVASNAKDEADRLSRIHDSLMEMHEKVMDQKADKAAVEKLESAIVNASKSRPGSTGTISLTDRLSITATPFVSRLGGAQVSSKERRAAFPSHEPSIRDAEQFMASLAAKRGSPPRRANLASGAVDHSRHAPVLRRRPASASASTLSQGSASAHESGVHRCGGPPTLQSAMHPPPTGNMAIEASLPGSKGRALSKSAESLNWEELAIALTPTCGLTSSSQPVMPLSASANSRPEPFSLALGRDGKPYRSAG